MIVIDTNTQIVSPTNMLLKYFYVSTLGILLLSVYSDYDVSLQSKLGRHSLGPPDASVPFDW